MTPSPMGPLDSSATTDQGQMRSMGAVDPMMLIAYVMQQMGPGATPEAARALLMQIGSGELMGPAQGLEASMPMAGATGAMGDMPPMGPPLQAPGQPPPPPGEPLSDPLMPNMGMPTLG